MGQTLQLRGIFKGEIKFSVRIYGHIIKIVRDTQRQVTWSPESFIDIGDV